MPNLFIIFHSLNVVLPSGCRVFGCGGVLGMWGWCGVVGVAVWVCGCVYAGRLGGGGAWLWVCVGVHLYTHPSTHQSTHPLSTQLSTHPPTHPLIHPPIQSSTHPSSHPSTHPTRYTVNRPSKCQIYCCYWVLCTSKGQICLILSITCFIQN